MRRSYAYPGQPNRRATIARSSASAAPPTGPVYTVDYQQGAAPYQTQLAPDPYWVPPPPGPAGYQPYGNANATPGRYAPAPRAPDVDYGERPGPVRNDRPNDPDKDKKKEDVNVYIVLGVVALLICCLLFLIAVLVFVYIYVSNDSKVIVTEKAYGKWAVVSDAKECASVAKDIFDKNGGLGDAAVAVMLCMGVTAPHLVGLGGGFIAVVYDNSKRNVRALDSLGISPAGTTADMFGSDLRSSKHGAKAAIVPGALAGYRELHKSFGKFPWKDIFTPAIQIARDGFRIGPHLAEALSDGAQGLGAAAALKHRFWNKHTNSPLRNGEKLVQPGLADMLEKISQQGVDYFYKGELAKEIASVVGGAGGLMNSTDLADYRPSWVDAMGVKMESGRYLYSAPIPGCGVILAAAVHKVAIRRIFREKSEEDITPRMSKEMIHSFVERLKLALARRPELGDQKDVLQKQESILYAIMDEISKFNGTTPMAHASDYGLRYAPEEDFGGAHLSIMAPNGDALSVTSGLNGAFGSMFVTPSGLLLNNYMDAFAKPGRRFDRDASPANLLGPRKRPMTSMVPTIITEAKTPSNVFGIFGAGGGLEGLSALAQLITCMRAFPLWRCARDNSRMQPTFRETVSGLVYVDGSNAAHMAALLQKLGHRVVLKTLRSTASGIISTGNFSLYAASDSVRSDGDSVGR